MTSSGDETLYELIGRLHDLGIGPQTVNSLLIKVSGRDMGRLYGLRFRQVLALRRELQQWITALERARP